MGRRTFLDKPINNAVLRRLEHYDGELVPVYLTMFGDWDLGWRENATFYLAQRGANGAVRVYDGKTKQRLRDYAVA